MLSISVMFYGDIFLMRLRFQCVMLSNKLSPWAVLLSLLYKYSHISDWPHRLRQ